MPLFKILKGDSSRIDTSVTPFHDGYAYFTPDDAGFYIDSEDDGVQRRVRINDPGMRRSSIAISVVLYADNWIDKEQSVNIQNVEGISNGFMGIAKSATDEQYIVAQNAMMRIAEQIDDSIVIHADGEVPTCDIPISIILLADSKALYATLSGENWVNNSQTVAIDGMTAKTNGVIDIATNATDEQTKAANLAVLKIESCGNGELTVTVLEDVPTCDIPIVVIVTD